MSRRAGALVLVVVGYLAALMISARLDPVYQSHALVSTGVVSAKGPDSIEHSLALAQGSAVRSAVEARHGFAGKVDVTVVDGGSLEFLARSHDPAEASMLANAYAEAYVELREKELTVDYGQGGQESERLRNAPPATRPRIVIPARPARSPLPPWPSQTGTVAALVLIALALAVPGRQAEE